MKPKHSKIKLNKDKNIHFYNVASSYHQLLSNIKEKQTQQTATSSTSHKQQAFPKHSAISYTTSNHSFNFSKRAVPKTKPTQTFNGSSFDSSSQNDNQQIQSASIFRTNIRKSSLQTPYNNNVCLTEVDKSKTKRANCNNANCDYNKANVNKYVCHGLHNKISFLDKLNMVSSSNSANGSCSNSNPLSKKNSISKQKKKAKSPKTKYEFSLGNTISMLIGQKGKNYFGVSQYKRQRSTPRENKLKTSLKNLSQKSNNGNCNSNNNHNQVTSLVNEHNNNSNVIKHKKQFSLHPKIKKTNSKNTLPKDLNININANININSPLSLSPSNNNTNTNQIHSASPEIISINSIFNNQEILITLDNLNEHFDNYESPKHSLKTLGNIRAYSANTYQGIIRNYNEDRVAIILNISKPPNYIGAWPKCSLFGVYDGHGGNLCADFLRDKLHTFIIKDKHFPSNPTQALIQGFAQAEEYFITNYATRYDNDSNELHLLDKSGSCATVALLVENTCYIANVGDSRAVISLNNGKDIRILTTDHKPNEHNEAMRIQVNGGKIYQTQTPTKLFSLNNNALSDSYDSSNNNSSQPNQILIGPYRVFPGRLSVSRTIGDVEAKLPEFGGKPNIVIAEPEVTSFTLENGDIDFLILGCDGIFDQLSNEEVVECVWMTCDGSCVENVHQQCKVGVDMIMKSALVRKTLDNITTVMVAFENFENKINELIAVCKNNEYERFTTEPSYHNNKYEDVQIKQYKQIVNATWKRFSPPTSSKDIMKGNCNDVKNKASSNKQLPKRNGFTIK